MGSARGDMSYTSAMLNNNPLKSTSGFAVTAFINIKAIPHKARLAALHEICLHIFRRIALTVIQYRYQAGTAQFQYNIFPYHHTTERYRP